MGVRNQIAVNIMEKYVDSNNKCIEYTVRVCGLDWKTYKISRQSLKNKILSGEIVCSDIYFTKDNRMMEKKEIPSLRKLDNEDKKNIDTIGKIIKEYRKELIKAIERDRKETELAIGHNGSALAQMSYNVSTATETVAAVEKIINNDDILLKVIDKVMK